MIRLIEFFNCGTIITSKNAVDYHTTKFSNIIEKIIRFFFFFFSSLRSASDRRGSFGDIVKYLDFLCFVDVANLMKNK